MADGGGSMKCCGVIKVGCIDLLEKFFSRKNIKNHFIFLKIESPFERGGMYPLYFIRKHCKCKEHF